MAPSDADRRRGEVGRLARRLHGDVGRRQGRRRGHGARGDGRRGDERRGGEATEGDSDGAESEVASDVLEHGILLGRPLLHAQATGWLWVVCRRVVLVDVRDEYSDDRCDDDCNEQYRQCNPENRLEHRSCLFSFLIYL